MNNFRQIAEISHVRVFYAKTADHIKSSAFKLSVLTGALDDTTVGEPGLYHWFEHVPFRGTERYPSGKKNARMLIAETGGVMGASTSSYYTEYWAHVPTRHLNRAIDIVTDLVSGPLLREKDIEAERKIIKEEIGQSLGNPKHVIRRKVIEEIWHNHPLRFSVLGSPEDLDKMDHTILHKARTHGYSTSRMFLTITTSLSEEEVIAMIEPQLKLLPYSPGVSKRKKMWTINPLEWKPGVETIGSTKLESSLVRLLFPLPSGLGVLEDDVLRWLMQTMFTHGSTDSPLLREIRHKRSLAYSASTTGFVGPDGGYIGFSVQTKNPKEVLRVLREKTIRDRRLRSWQWLKTVKEGLRNARDMEVSTPSSDVDTASDKIYATGDVISQDTYYEILELISIATVRDELEKIFVLENARTFIFEGGK